MEMNAVGWADFRVNISVARINLTKSDGSKVSQIGASVVSLGTIYYDPVKDVIATMGLKAYEALICVPKSVKYESQFCGNYCSFYAVLYLINDSFLVNSF